MNSAQLTVDDLEAVQLLAGGHVNRGSDIALKVIGDTVWLGGADVTPATGFPWTQAEGPLGSSDLVGGDSLYGICDTGESATVYVLRTQEA